MATTEENSKGTCPICKAREMADHCESKNCQWLHCKSKGCDATLDIVAGLGHHLDLAQAKDPKTGTVIRRRVRRMGGEWRERSYG